MATRRSSEYQNRYSSSQMTGYPPPPDRTPSAQSSNSRSPLYAPLAHPTPPHLAHSRYSSADLYALQPEGGGGGGREGQSQTASTGLLPQQQNSPYRDHDDSDSDDDEEGGGFGTYRDFQTVSDSRQSRFSTGLPPLNPRMSTSGTMSTLQNPGGSTYQLKEQISSTAKFEGGAYETVAMPKISGDWSRGEGLNEKNDRKFAKSRRKRQEVKGFVGSTYEKAKRKWKIVVPAILIFLVGLILILYFCIPRTPTITFKHQKVPSTVFTSTDENPFITSTDPVSYSFRGNLIFALDASSSYVPVKYSSFGISVKLRETGDEIGRTTWSDGEISIPGKSVTSYEFPILFSGNYSSDSDETFSIMKNSCAHLYASTYREPLNLTVEVTSSIMGVIGEGKREATVTNVVCPIQWSGSAN